MIKILFIDDEPIRVWPFTRKYDIRIAHGFEQVHFYLQQNPLWRPDVICLDHDMPLMDGYQVAQSFLIARSIPVVVHSMNQVGAADIIRLLQEYAVPCRALPITESIPGAWIRKVEAFLAELK